MFDTERVHRERSRPLLERVVSLAAVAIEQARAREDLEYRAYHDALTGLPNRALLNDRLTHALKRSRRDETAVAVLFLDLDRFKFVNDSLGHDAGDRLLTQIAQRMIAGLRASDTVARLGGDEFVVVVEDVKDELEVHAAVQRVAAILEEPFEVDAETLFVSASRLVPCVIVDASDVPACPTTLGSRLSRKRSSAPPSTVIGVNT